MSLLTDFYRQCRTAPDGLALIEGERRFSYRQLQHEADRLCARLREHAPRCERIAIALDRGIDAVVAILATLQAGACYVPLDIKNPAERLQYICRDSDPHCVIGRGSCPGWLPHSELWLDIAAERTTFSNVLESTEVDDESLAAILYTSGSTGSPKGVALSHRAMLNFASWAANTFTLGPGDRIASLAPFHFDLSVFDLFAGLRSGACIHFVPAGLTLAPSRLSAWLAEQKITTFYTVPSLLGFLALKGALADTPLPNLKRILFAGEVFPTPLLKRLCGLLPAVRFYNLYGPTETNVCCYWPVQRDRLLDDTPIPIGLPACGAELEIDGDSGELRVRCANNLSGYWREGQLTEFRSSSEFYSTGDKVSLNDHGEYCYHGRLDRMLKCSGYRVEPAEIETVLLQCSGVIRCAVVGVEDSTSGQRPAAAVVLNEYTELADIVSASKRKLPFYMHPCRFIQLTSLPELANGKTDYLTVKRRLESR